MNENDRATNRQELWEQTNQEFRETTDKLGREIDEGIFDTVIALNVLGINTVGSCEGHLDHGVAAPWVDIESGEDVSELSTKWSEKYDRVEELEAKLQNKRRPLFRQRINKLLDKLYPELHALRKELDKPRLRELQKVMVLLDEFYTGRFVPYDVRLVLQSFGGAPRLQSQGADIQDINDEETRQRKLLEYQAEMKALTEFLKKKALG